MAVEVIRFAAVALLLVDAVTYAVWIGAWPALAWLGAAIATANLLKAE